MPARVRRKKMITRYYIKGMIYRRYKYISAIKNKHRL